MSAIANNIKEKYIILLKYEGIEYKVHPVAQKKELLHLKWWNLFLPLKESVT